MTLRACTLLYSPASCIIARSDGRREEKERKEKKGKAFHHFVTLYLTHTVTDRAVSASDSKHWFTTSFLQPLPYFSYAIGSRKLSANEQFFVGVTNNSYKTRRVIYSCQQSLHQHKQNHNRLNRDGTLFFSFSFYPGWMRLVFTCVLGR